jgi:hypothetical protein
MTGGAGPGKLCSPQEGTDCHERRCWQEGATIVAGHSYGGQIMTASTLQDVMGVPAWKSLPSWYLVADGDQAIPPDADRQFAKRMGAKTVEVSTNHVAMVSHPDEVLNLIRTAARAVPITT